MCQHLSFIGFGKATGGKAKVRTGLGKSDCPGSQGGLWKRVKKRAPYFYPDDTIANFLLLEPIPIGSVGK